MCHKARGRQRTDSSHVLAAIRVLSRLENIGETLRHTLNTLAAADSDWLLRHVPFEWFDRYSRRIEEARLPAGKKEQQTLAMAFARDDYALLTWLGEESAPPALRQLPAVETLRRVWIQQFYREETEPAGVRVRWREEKEMPTAAERIHSPFDPDAVIVSKAISPGPGTRFS